MAGTIERVNDVVGVWSIGELWVGDRSGPVCEIPDVVPSGSVRAVADGPGKVDRGAIGATDSVVGRSGICVCDRAASGKRDLF